METSIKKLYVMTDPPDLLIGFVNGLMHRVPVTEVMRHLHDHVERLNIDTEEFACCNEIRIYDPKGIITQIDHDEELAGIPLLIIHAAADLIQRSSADYCTDVGKIAGRYQFTKLNVHRSSGERVGT